MLLWAKQVDSLLSVITTLQSIQSEHTFLGGREFVVVIAGVGVSELGGGERVLVGFERRFEVGFFCSWTDMDAIGEE